MDFEKSDFIMKVKNLIKKSGLSQKQVAELSGVTPVAFSYYMSGKRFPKSSIIANIANVLQTTTDYLLGAEKEKEIRFEEVKEIILNCALEMTNEERLEIATQLLKMNENGEKK